MTKIRVSAFISPVAITATQLDGNKEEGFMVEIGHRGHKVSCQLWLCEGDCHSKGARE